jgi:hypothetical protein
VTGRFGSRVRAMPEVLGPTAPVPRSASREPGDRLEGSDRPAGSSRGLTRGLRGAYEATHLELLAPVNLQKLSEIAAQMKLC